MRLELPRLGRGNPTKSWDTASSVRIIPDVTTSSPLDRPVKLGVNVESIIDEGAVRKGIKNLISTIIFIPNTWEKQISWVTICVKYRCDLFQSK